MLSVPLRGDIHSGLGGSVCRAPSGGQENPRLPRSLQFLLIVPIWLLALYFRTFGIALTSSYRPLVQNNWLKSANSRPIDRVAGSGQVSSRLICNPDQPQGGQAHLRSHTHAPAGCRPH